MEELGATVSAYSYKNGKLTFLQRISALPAGFTGKKSGADIHISPDGKFLYASVRDDANMIAIFSIDNKTGKLAAKSHVSTKGKTPRNFNLDPSGNWLLAANQNSDNIILFKRDKQTGLLQVTGRHIDIGNPVCIKWID